MANYGTNVPGNVIVNQPGAFQPLLTLPDPMFPRGVGRPWSTGLCDCCNDCAICVLSTFIPCYICAMSKQMGESAIMPCCVHPSLLVMRSNFRGKHNIEGNLIDDCCTTTCCYLCAKCQLAREIQLIKYGHAAPWKIMHRIHQMNFKKNRIDFHHSPLTSWFEGKTVLIT